MPCKVGGVEMAVTRRHNQVGIEVAGPRHRGAGRERGAMLVIGDLEMGEAFMQVEFAFKDVPGTEPPRLFYPLECIGSAPAERIGRVDPDRAIQKAQGILAATARKFADARHRL